MFSKKNVLKISLAALVVFGAFSNKAVAMGATEQVSFTVAETVTVGGHILAPGRYTVRPSSSSNALIITRADNNQFVTFVLPISKDLRQGEAPAVSLVGSGSGKAVASVYFPGNERAYYFNTKQ